MESHQVQQKIYNKPSREDWMRWAEVVIDRLTTCVHVYSKPPHDGEFMPEAERQTKNAKTLDLLRRIHGLTDDASTPSDSFEDVERHDQRVIAGLRVLMQETLERLPGLSTDMQKLLKSPWFDKCNGRLANELFRGPMGAEAEGIGSGHPEHGRLPESLTDLLEEEEMGDTRAATREVQMPQRDGMQLPHRATSRSRMGSAGRVD